MNYAAKNISNYALRLLLAMLLGIGGAELGSAREMALDDVLTRSRQNTTAQRQIIDLSYEQGMADVAVVKSAALPTISSNITANRVSRSLVGQGGGAQSGGGQSTPVQESAMSGPNETRSFGHQYGVGVNLQTPIVAFGRIGVLSKIEDQHVKLLASMRDQQMQAYYMHIVQLYNTALLNLNRSEAAKRSASHARAVADFTQVEYEGGGRSRIDLLRSKSFSSTAVAEHRASMIRSASALENLRIALGMSIEEPLLLKPGIDDKSRFLQVDKKAEGVRPELKLKEQEVLVNNLWSHYRKGEYWPTLYLTGGANSNIDNVAGPGRSNPGTPAQDAFKDERMNYSIGLSLQWTLFDGFRTPATARKAAAQAKMSQIEMETLLREDARAKNEALANLEIVDVILAAAVDARDAAQLSFQQIESDYKEGASSLQDMLEMQKELAAAENQVFEVYANKVLAVATYKLVHGIHIGGESL